MFAVFTGTPGAGKTLNLIKYAIEDEAFKGRQVYQYGIKGCRVPDWINLSQEQFEDWHNFIPNDSVLVVDECQKFWRAGAASNKLPAHLTEIETHRHKGIDILATCQAPQQLHTMAKVLINLHRHFNRPFGKEKWISYDWDNVVSNPNSKAQQEIAIKETGTFDKKIYKLYDSASLHTQIDRFPKKYYVYGALAVLLGVVLIYFAYLRITRDQVAEVVPEPVKQQQGGSSSPTANFGDRRPVLTLAKVVEDLTPVVKNRPDTAPIYSQFWQPLDYPREQYIAWTKLEKYTCTVYSQQGTKLDVDQAACAHALQNGRTFDFRIPPTPERLNAASSEVRAAQQSEAANGQGRGRYTVVESSGAPEFPTAANSYRGIR